MTRDEFITWALSKGWKKDSYGHLQKEAPKLLAKPEKKSQYRLKLSKYLVRYEIKVGKSHWVRIRSGYFSKLTISPEGKLQGMKR